MEELLYFFQKFDKSLLSLNDIHLNKYYVETDNKKDIKYLYMIVNGSNKKNVY